MPSEKKAQLAAYKARKALYQVVCDGNENWRELGHELVKAYGEKVTGVWPFQSTQLRDWLTYEDDTGLTVLHVAAGTDSVEGTQWLLEHGADVNQLSTVTAMTALDYAKHMNCPGTVKVLEEWDAQAASEVLNENRGHAAVKAQGNCVLQ